MKSLKHLFRYGPGPSSSHTIAPYLAGKAFRKRLPKSPDEVVVTFYGSLARTGEGHGSSKAVIDGVRDFKVRVVLDCETPVKHPLTMKFQAMKNGACYFEDTYISVGGGELRCDNDDTVNERGIYPFDSLDEIKEYMRKHHITNFRDFCLIFERKTIDNYLMKALKRMFACIEESLQKEGRIPANKNPVLNVNRSARQIYQKAIKLPRGTDRKTMLIVAYAYAVAESSACGERVVTAPTCGSSGVLPAILYYGYRHDHVSLTRLRDALYAAGVIGNIVKQNASIAGSVGGCQAEIGTASSMAAAALCAIKGLNADQIEYAAEVAMEHFLGLSCDPVDGYVIIPCIERNGIGALRALNCYCFAKLISPVREHHVKFDEVVRAMKMTGDSLSADYKETSVGGLACVLHRDC